MFKDVNYSQTFLRSNEYQYKIKKKKVQADAMEYEAEVTARDL